MRFQGPASSAIFRPKNRADLRAAELRNDSSRVVSLMYPHVITMPKYEPQNILTAPCRSCQTRPYGPRGPRPNHQLQPCSCQLARRICAFLNPISGPVFGTEIAPCALRVFRDVPKIGPISGPKNSPQNQTENQKTFDALRKNNEFQVW